MLLLNTHHLLNSFRVNHAREELIASVQAQLDAKQQLLDELEAACAEAHWETEAEAPAQQEQPEAANSAESEQHASMTPEAPQQAAPNLERILDAMDQIPT